MTIVSASNIYRAETEDPALTEAHAAGWQAYLSGNPSSMNPHAVGSVERATWAEGWVDAEQEGAEQC